MLRCTVLDDFQGGATAFADWAPVSNRVAVRTLREHVPDEAQLAQVLHADEIVVIMRERTAFPESLFGRLPRLRLLVTTGFRNASIDLSAAARHGVTVAAALTNLLVHPPSRYTQQVARCHRADQRVLGEATPIQQLLAGCLARRPTRLHNRVRVAFGELASPP
jgi:hypothetical protein